MMESWLATERLGLHRKCLEGPITITNDIPSIADKHSKPSVRISRSLVSKIGKAQDLAKKPAGQTAGTQFEEICEEFIAACFRHFAHLRPGQFCVKRGSEISEFDQYAHLDELRLLSDANRELKTLLGTDYLIKPDVVVIKQPEPDENINRTRALVDETVARHTALRAVNNAKATLHASISCKLTIRSDRVQNTRSEALNLIRNRKGRLPHIVAVTAEPLPSRIASIALGTGDMDCVYHFALPELVATLREQGRDESIDLVEMMIDGQRLRDIADLPLDLVI